LFRQRFFLDATSLFEMLTKENDGLKLSSAYVNRSVRGAFRIAVKKLITWNSGEPEGIVPFSLIEKAINSELKTLVEKIIENAGHTKKTLSRPVKSFAVPTLVNLNDVLTWPLKNKIISMAGAHYHMLKMLNSHARVMLQREQFDDFMSSAFTKTVEKIRCSRDSMKMVPLSIVESTIKSEVEILFQNMLQQQGTSNRESATSGCDQLMATTTQGDEYLNLASVSSSSYLSVRSDLKLQTSTSENVNHSSVEGFEYDPNQNSRETEQNFDIFQDQNPPDRSLKHQISLGRCPEAGCSVFYPGDRGVIKLRSHLLESHIYPRYMLKNRQLLCCVGLSNARGVSHYKSKHCNLNLSIRSLLLNLLIDHLKILRCPICRNQYTRNLITRKVAYSVFEMKENTMEFRFFITHNPDRAGHFYLKM